MIISKYRNLRGAGCGLLGMILGIGLGIGIGVLFNQIPRGSYFESESLGHENSVLIACIATGATFGCLLGIVTGIFGCKETSIEEDQPVIEPGYVQITLKKTQYEKECTPLLPPGKHDTTYSGPMTHTM